MVEPNRFIAAMSGMSSLGKRPSQAASSMMGRTFSSTQDRTVSRTRRCSSVKRLSQAREATLGLMLRNGIAAPNPLSHPLHSPSRIMSVFTGGSAYSMANSIADGYIITSELTFKKFQASDLQTFLAESDRLLREIRGNQAPIDD